jgi:hypothetical protein
VGKERYMIGSREKVDYSIELSNCHLIPGMALANLPEMRKGKKWGKEEKLKNKGRFFF